MKKILGLLIFIFFLLTSSSIATSNSDPRFFGTYCGEKKFCKGVGPFKNCKSVKDIKANLNYTETPKGGLVHGSGAGKIDGNELRFTIGGGCCSSRCA